MTRPAATSVYALLGLALAWMPVSCPAWADEEGAGSLTEAATERAERGPGLTGDWGGLRPRLAEAGVRVSLSYVGDLLRDARGGSRRGTTYGGVFLPELEVDLGRVAGWAGATFHASAVSIHGRDLTSYYVQNLMAVSEIEGRPATRLYDLWLEQSLFRGRVTARAGMFTADEEFMLVGDGGVFVNSTFGWPGWAATDLPGGGPAYPLPVPAARLRVQATPRLSLMAAVFSGDATGHAGYNLQQDQTSGTVISFSGGALVMLEMAYAPAPEHGLPTVFKLGGWYHTSRHFLDQGVDADGRSLAAGGEPRQHRGDWAVYGLVDRRLINLDADRFVGAFFRLAVLPPDRNLIDLYADAGIALHGPTAGRPRDVVGLGVGYARVGRHAADLDRSLRAFDAGYPVRDREIVLDLTYRAEVTPWLHLQPDLQGVIHPGGSGAAPDAVVVGLRTAVTF